MQGFLFAISFLTRIPVPFNIDYNNKLPSRSFSYFTMVGFIIGLILVMADRLFSYLLPVSIVNILLLILLVYLTGALHLDGFMDSVDGLFSCREKERVLEIMHDSLTGAFGVISVILLLLLKYVLLVELKGTIRLPLLILMPVISRWMLVYSAYRYPLATSSKLGKGFNYDLGIKQIFFSSLILIIACICTMFLWKINFLNLLMPFSVNWLVVILISHYVIKQIDGLTGDIYGTINEISEIIVLLIGVITIHAF